LVLDPLPPPLRRRGAALDRAHALHSLTGQPDLASEVARREVVDLDTLRRIGVPDAHHPTVLRAGPWLISSARARRAQDEVLQALSEHERARPLERGLPLTVLAERLGLPTPQLVATVVRAPLELVGGRVVAPGGDTLPPQVEHALTELTDDLTRSPFAAPTADRLRGLGLDAARIGAAAQAGRLIRLAPGIVLLPDADTRAIELLRELPQPFTTSEARSHLATSRRVVLPLLEHLDRARLTRRLPDDRRLVL
jgi:selenocysteine-specific elongation factor